MSKILTRISSNSAAMPKPLSRGWLLIISAVAAWGLAVLVVLGAFRLADYLV